MADIPENDFIFEVRNIKKYFPMDSYKLAKSKIRYLHAVDDLSLIHISEPTRH